LSVDVELQVFAHDIDPLSYCGALLSAFGIPGPESVVLGHLLGVDLRIDAHVHYTDFATGVGTSDRRADLLFLLDVLAVATEALGNLVHPDVLTPVHTGLRRGLGEGALVHTHFQAPLVVHTHHAYQRKILPRSGFQ